MRFSANHAAGRVAKWQGIGLQSRSSSGSIPTPSSTYLRGKRPFTGAQFVSFKELRTACDVG